MNSHNESVETIVSEKGQITIPKRLRGRLGIRPGQVQEFSEILGPSIIEQELREAGFLRLAQLNA